MSKLAGSANDKETITNDLNHEETSNSDASIDENYSTFGLDLSMLPPLYQYSSGPLNTLFYPRFFNPFFTLQSENIEQPGCSPQNFEEIQENPNHSEDPEDSNNHNTIYNLIEDPEKNVNSAEEPNQEYIDLKPCLVTDFNLKPIQCQFTQETFWHAINTDPNLTNTYSLIESVPETNDQEDHLAHLSQPPNIECNCCCMNNINQDFPAKESDRMIANPSDINKQKKSKRGRPKKKEWEYEPVYGDFKCIFCDYFATVLYEFLHHLDTHAGVTSPYSCPLCGKDFKFMLVWRNHICSHMSLRPFKCKQCHAAYTTNGELTRHNRYKHGGGKPHKCDRCDYECVELAKLVRHKRMHDGDKPFKCPTCVYTSYDKSKIRRHYVIHTREKPFECELCHSRFTQSGSLKTHLSNVHGMDKVEFKCIYCKVFITQNLGELRNHIKTMHREPRPLMHTDHLPVIHYPVTSSQAAIEN